MGCADDNMIEFWIEWYKAGSLERYEMLKRLVNLHHPFFKDPNIPGDLQRRIFIILLLMYLEDFAEALEYYFQKEKGGDESGC